MGESRKPDSESGNKDSVVRETEHDAGGPKSPYGNKMWPHRDKATCFNEVQAQRFSHPACRECVSAETTRDVKRAARGPVTGRLPLLRRRPGNARASQAQPKIRTSQAGPKSTRLDFFSSSVEFQTSPWRISANLSCRVNVS